VLVFTLTTFGAGTAAVAKDVDANPGSTPPVEAHLLGKDLSVRLPALTEGCRHRAIADLYLGGLDQPLEAFHGTS